MSLIATLVTTIVPALLPATKDGIRALINRKAKGAQKEPANFEEQTQLMQLDIDRFKAINEADRHGNANMPWWVDAVKTLQRPFYGSLLLILYAVCILSDAPPDTTQDVALFVRSFGFYLFGERAYMHLQTRAKL